MNRSKIIKILLFTVAGVFFADLALFAGSLAVQPQGIAKPLSGGLPLIKDLSKGRSLLAPSFKESLRPKANFNPLRKTPSALSFKTRITPHHISTPQTKPRVFNKKIYVSPSVKRNYIFKMSNFPQRLSPSVSSISKINKIKPIRPLINTQYPKLKYPTTPFPLKVLKGKKINSIKPFISPAPKGLFLPLRKTSPKKPDLPPLKPTPFKSSEAIPLSSPVKNLPTPRGSSSQLIYFGLLGVWGMLKPRKTKLLFALLKRREQVEIEELVQELYGFGRSINNRASPSLDGRRQPSPSSIQEKGFLRNEPRR